MYLGGGGWQPVYTPVFSGWVIECNWNFKKNFESNILNFEFRPSD